MFASFIFKLIFVCYNKYICNYLYLYYKLKLIKIILLLEFEFENSGFVALSRVLYVELGEK